MKLFHLVLFCLLSFPAIAGERYCNVLVVKVYDGDTFTADISGKITRIRLANIDAPELDQPGGIVARDFLCDVIFNKKVCVDKQSVDMYQRWIANVYVDDFLLNRLLVLSGNAWVYVGYNKDFLLKKMEDQAKASKLGIWGQDNPTAPWAWRKIKKQRSLEKL
jgi:endonuclease YncB( thermonuclease family)